MPWSPLKYTEQIFGEFQGEQVVSKNALWKSVIKHTKLVKDQTIVQLIKVYERLGFIELDVNTGTTVKLNWDEIDKFVLQEKSKQ